jgi:homocysteine S-methyltransferase
VDHPFVDRLSRGPLVGDGAMGTELFARGLRPDQCVDALNLTLPDLIQQVHRDYLAAGSELIETNTFGANRFRLEQFGLADRVREINRAGATIAREAREIMGESIFVAGSIGPSGARFRPIGPVSYDAVADAFREQAEALVEKGVDLLLFETFTNLDELTAAIAAVQRMCDLPIVAMLSFDDTRRTTSGHTAEQAVANLEQLGVAVVGVNCGIGPQQALDLVGQFARVSPRPPRRLVAAQPNAGYPMRVGGRVAYAATPEYFAGFAASAVSAGATLIGGCCGTSPAHIRAMRQALAAEAPSAPKVVAMPARPQPIAPPRDDEAPTSFAAKLAAGEFVVSVEIDPPKGSNPAKALRGARQVQDAGADLINIGDSPMAKVRMSALGLALLIQQNLGIDTMVHQSPRDRNLMALQSDLLGMHALGIRHIIAVTGDQLRSSTNPPVTAVWDVDSIGLLSIIKRMNQGFDYAGTSIGRPTRFVVACAVSPNVDDLDHELDRLRRKLDAGADFVMTQPLFSREQIDRFLQRAGQLPVPLVLGVVPLESYRQAELLHNEVPGFRVPDDIRERMRQAGDRGAEEGLRIAEELVDEARDLVSGIYIITSYGRYDAAASLVRRLKPSRLETVS